MERDKKVVVITGASRGIGFQLAKDYVARGALVVATARNPETAHELQALHNHHKDSVVIVPLDVVSSESIDSAAREVAAKVDRVDVLINNAGVLPFPDDANQPDIVEKLRDTLNVNTIAPLAVTQAFLPLISKSLDPRIINVSSTLGSLEKYGKIYPVPATTYRVSKTALNMLTRALASELGRTETTTSEPQQPQKPIIVAVCPGWVQTDMGKKAGGTPPLTVEQSSSALVKLIDSLTAKDNGTYLDRNGPIEW